MRERERERGREKCGSWWPEKTLDKNICFLIERDNYLWGNYYYETEEN